MSAHHQSPEMLSTDDAHSTSSRIPLISGNLTLWRGGMPGEVLGERRFFRLWDRYELFRFALHRAHIIIRELVHYECEFMSNSVQVSMFFAVAFFFQRDTDSSLVAVQVRFRDSGPYPGNNNQLHCTAAATHCPNMVFSLFTCVHQASIDYLRRSSGNGVGGHLYCEVRPRHSAQNSFILKATTGEEMQRWVLLMQQQSQHHRENDRILLFEHVIGTIESETSDIQERAWFQNQASAKI